MTRPEFRHIRRMVYALKRAYPLKIQLRRTTGNDTNMVTGVKSETVHKVTIKKAVLLPSRGLRDFSYDLSFIAANKNFTYGGFYDHKVRRVLIDRRDIPSSFPIDLNMQVDFDSKRYEVKEVWEYEHNECIVLVLDSLVGATSTEVYEVDAQDTATLSQDVADELQ